MPEKNVKIDRIVGGKKFDIFKAIEIVPFANGLAHLWP